MKYLLLLISLFLLWPNSANTGPTGNGKTSWIKGDVMSAYSFSISQESFRPIQKPVVCGPQKDIFKKIEENAGETDLEFIGIFETSDSQIAFSVSRNLKTKTFTIIETSVSGISCVIGTGKYVGDEEARGPKL
jgi:hypothetical protein